MKSVRYCESKKYVTKARNSVPEIVAAVGNKWEMSGKTGPVDDINKLYQQDGYV
jgi:hypothetical protein